MLMLRVWAEYGTWPETCAEKLRDVLRGHDEDELLDRTVTDINADWLYDLKSTEAAAQRRAETDAGPDIPGGGAT